MQRCETLQNMYNMVWFQSSGTNARIEALERFLYKEPSFASLPLQHFVPANTNLNQNFLVYQQASITGETTLIDFAGS